MKLLGKFIVLGKPGIKKNRKQIARNKKTGSVIIVSSAEYRQWERDALKQLAAQWDRLTIPKTIKLHAEITVYQSDRQRADIDNLIGGPLDALQKAEIVSNDYQFESVGAVRYRDTENPRVEISIFEKEELV